MTKEYEVRTIRITSKSVHNRFEYKKVDLEPEYQSSIIESLFLDYPLKRIVIHDDERSIEKVIYGSEIIQTINDFFNNNFMFVPKILTGVPSNYFLSMPRQYQRRIEQAYVDFVVLCTWKKDVDIKEISKLLNYTHNY